PARDHRPGALPDRAAAAGPGLRAAGGAAGPQFAAADPVRQRGDRLPRLPGGHGPDAAGHRLAGRGQAAARRRPVVAGAAVAGAGCVVRLRRRPTAAAALAQEPRMKPFPKIHDVYVGRVLLGTVLLTWAVLVGLDFVIGGLMPEIDDIGTGDYDFSTALVYVIYTLPRRAYFLFPTAAVIGSLMGLGQLAATSERTALRALGLSRRRLGLAVAMALAVLTALMVVNGETLAPWGQRRADALKASARSPDMIVAQYSGLWAREG